MAKSLNTALQENRSVSTDFSYQKIGWKFPTDFRQISQENGSLILATGNLRITDQNFDQKNLSEI